jgi:hypothetical protein
MPFSKDAIEDKLAVDYICERLAEPDRAEKERRICATVHQVLTVLRAQYSITGSIGLSLGPRIVNYSREGSERVMELRITTKDPKYALGGGQLNVILFEVDEAKEEFTGRFWTDSKLDLELS